mmetsp:Transcript_47926/g.78930  ORF Transcript_47926/g.78930 Transcript_47926/m.78930 type:complete len:128 (-) Transcript_47926:222-605(-)
MCLHLYAVDGMCVGLEWLFLGLRAEVCTEVVFVQQLATDCMFLHGRIAWQEIGHGFFGGAHPSPAVLFLSVFNPRPPPRAVMPPVPVTRSVGEICGINDESVTWSTSSFAFINLLPGVQVSFRTVAF